MKRIISLTLAVVLLVTLALFATSCSMESMTGYTKLRDHIKAVGGDEPVVTLDAAKVGINSASVSVVTTEEGEQYVCLIGYAVNTTSGTVYQVRLELTDSPEKAELIYEVLNASTAQRIAMGTATVLLTHYTGEDFITFEEVENINAASELTHRRQAQVLLNSLLLALDTYTTANMDMDLHDYGFIALSAKYMAPVESAEVQEDLGGAFSPARLSMAGLMIIQGVGMVFLVLAILWMVLLIFKKVFYKDPNKQDKKEEAPVEAPAPVAAPAPADDGALVAAITAAVAAYIDSDPALSSQFAGGFRVVSFK
ncbi:MAG: OadG family protein, partial [Clostridia bacterium]|nr:OadG family protein [Clostridia bacterium]